MAHPAISVRMSEKLLQPMPPSLAPARHVRALVVSPQMELHKPLLRTLEFLHVDTILCGRLAQAEEVLARQGVDIVFCDDHLPDGSYSDLVRLNHGGSKIARVVVTTRTGDWDLYFTALEKGAFDVIQSPCYEMDVKMTIGRVLREDETMDA